MPLSPPPFRYRPAAFARVAWALLLSTLLFGCRPFEVRGASATGPAGRPAELPPTSAVALYGDSRSNPAVHAKIVEAILRTRPSAVFHTGDMVNRGSDPDDWRSFDEITRALRASTEFYPVRGNHEGSSPVYFQHLSPPGNGRWYAVRKGEVHFVVLDTNENLGEGSPQLAWLEEELRKAETAARFTVVLGHHPPFATGEHREDEKGLRRTVVPLLERYGVELHVAGHVHTYEKSASNGVYYLVTGGGGAPLHRQTRSSPESLRFVSAYHFCRVWTADGRLEVEAQDLDGRVIDRFQIQPSSGARLDKGEGRGKP